MQMEMETHKSQEKDLRDEISHIKLNNIQLFNEMTMMEEKYNVAIEHMKHYETIMESMSSALESNSTITIHKDKEKEKEKEKEKIIEGIHNNWNTNKSKK